MAELGERSTGEGSGPPPLAPGGAVAGGRYRLRECHGGVAGQSFWRASDLRLRRDVALVFVDPLPGEDGMGSAAGVLDRTTELTRVYSSGLARVIDVIRGRRGGIVVTEWTPGRNLAAAAREPRPDDAAWAVRELADAAARAEDEGLVLGVDSPDRVRVAEDGRAVLAFPGVSAGADARGDVRGVGAVLHTLLTGLWPGELPEGSDAHEPDGGRPDRAPTGDDGAPSTPCEDRDGVPTEAGVLATRALDGSSVSSAATVRSMIDRLGGAGAHHPPSPALSHGSPAAATAEPARAGSSVAAAEPAWRDPDAEHPYSLADHDEAEQHKRWMIMAGSGAAAVVVMALLATWLLGGFGSGRDSQPLSEQLDALERAAQESRAAATSSAAPPSGEAARPQPTTPVKVVTATSWQPASSQGVAENSATAPKTVDGDRSTTWSTDTYYSQFGTGAGAYKPGIGLLLTLDSVQKPAQLVLESPDEGVSFQVRSARTESPESVEETQPLGTGTVSGGKATVTFDTPTDTRYVLVWITKLKASGTQSYSAKVSEITLTR